MLVYHCIAADTVNTSLSSDLTSVSPAHVTGYQQVQVFFASLGLERFSPHHISPSKSLSCKRCLSCVLDIRYSAGCGWLFFVDNVSCASRQGLYIRTQAWKPAWRTVSQLKHKTIELYETVGI